MEVRFSRERTVCAGMRLDARVQPIAARLAFNLSPFPFSAILAPVAPGRERDHGEGIRGTAATRAEEDRHPLRRDRQRDQREHLERPEALSLPAQDGEDASAAAGVL